MSLRVKRSNFYIIFSILSMISEPIVVSAIGPNFDYYTKIKAEFQYTDYTEYRWPEFLDYIYGDQDFLQPSPFLAKFPEKRALIKLTQAFGPDFFISVKYQHSDLDRVYNYDDTGNESVRKDVEQIYNLYGEYSVSDNFSLNSSIQHTRAFNSFRGYMWDGGGKYDFGGFFKIEPSLSLYWNEVAGAQQKSQSYTLKLRQALTNASALQVKYNYFHAQGAQGFSFHTVTLWLSQWFPTQTALHLSMRYHWDTQKGKSLAPGIELGQYLNWATTLNVTYRFFTMENEDPASSFYQQITGDSFDSNSFSVILKRNQWTNTDFILKYRYYTCNQDVKMHTYLFSVEQVF